MIAEAGHLFLIIAFALSILQIFVPVYGIASHKLSMVNATAKIALVTCGFVIAAFLALMHGFVTSDFSIALVAQHSHSSKPMIYKISGLWGNHEGSLLLWILILCLFAAVLAAGFKAMPAIFKARILGVQGVIATAFIAFSLFTSNPFARLSSPPFDGRGLNPVLQDPGLAMHPPMLYIGYVGLSLAFAFAVAGLIEGHIDNLWARWVRPFILAAWCALTLGIGLGSWWAYYELGWGGWWFWDPVENASLMPWLIATALLHSALVLERRGALKSWTILLAILAFSLSLLGTFIVRSGILVSVHSFASDPSRGVFILAILMVAIGIPLALFAWRGPKLTSSGDFAIISREGMLIVNNLLLVSSTVVVLTGTLYPLAYELANGGKISVGPPYFNATFNPLLALMALGMAIGPLFAWRQQSLGRLSKIFTIMALAVLIAMITYVFALQPAGVTAIAAAGIII
ncbi:MAG: heme lyase CcmF/NrfE family subunit, partial [Candidatus Puniceispirillum sp.]